MVQRSGLTPHPFLSRSVRSNYTRPRTGVVRAMVTPARREQTEWVFDGNWLRCPFQVHRHFRMEPNGNNLMESNRGMLHR